MGDVDEMFVQRLHAVIVYYDVAGWVEEREVVEVAWKKTRALINKGPGPLEPANPGPKFAND